MSFTLFSAMKNEAPFLLEWVAYHKAIGFDRLFFGYAALNFLIAVFVFCLVPETAGKTLKDIQQ